MGACYYDLVDAPPGVYYWNPDTGQWCERPDEDAPPPPPARRIIDGGTP